MAEALDPVTLAVLSTSSALVVGLLGASFFLVLGWLLGWMGRPKRDHEVAWLRAENDDLHDRLAQALEDERDERYLLQNVTAGYVGNSPLWLRAGGSGYTQWPDEAERFTLADVRQVVRTTVGAAIYPEMMVLGKQRATVDAQHLGDPLPFVVELEPGVWLADTEGDPGRTLQRDNAERFPDQMAANDALHAARKFREFPRASIDLLS